jgi:hypothetical protein
MDEATRRRDTFDLEKSAPLVLADGQTWHARRPVLAVAPEFGADGSVTLLNCYELPRLDGQGVDLDFDGLVKTMLTSRDNEGLKAIFAVVRHMLLSNYDLTPEELSGLLRWHASDPAFSRFITAVMEAATAGPPEADPIAGAEAALFGAAPPATTPEPAESIL